MVEGRAGSRVEQDMILTQFNYDTIKITYDAPVESPGRNKHNCEEETWRGAQIFFEQKADVATLRIKKGDKSILLGRAKVIELTPWSAKFEAYWWEGHEFQYNKDGALSKRQKSGFKQLIRADIICEV